MLMCQARSFRLRALSAYCLIPAASGIISICILFHLFVCALCWMQSRKSVLYGLTRWNEMWKAPIILIIIIITIMMMLLLLWLRLSSSKKFVTDYKTRLHASINIHINILYILNVFCSFFLSCISDSVLYIVNFIIIFFCFLLLFLLLLSLLLWWP